MTSKVSSMPNLPAAARECIRSYLSPASCAAVKMSNKGFAQGVLGATLIPQFLDPNKRPKSILDAIDRSFEALRKYSRSSFCLYNGDTTYKICEIDEKALITALIASAPKQKKFYFLDIGAGNFQLGDYLAHHFDQCLAVDITIHIISVRGESYSGKEIRKTKRCIIYNFGNFKVEDLNRELQKHKLDMCNKVDLVVSRFCFRHLVDPVGTFIQMYNLLCPQRGYCLMDGFYFFEGRIKKSSWTLDSFNERMINLLRDTHAAFLMQDYRTHHSLNRFVLQRLHTAPCNIPMRYEGRVPKGDIAIASACIPLFTRVRLSPWNSQIPLRTRELSGKQIVGFYGDRNLYRWLEKNHLFRSTEGAQGNTTRWFPIDKQLVSPLHSAIEMGTIASVKQTLDQNDIQTIDDLDISGRTPLWISIQKKKKDVCILLLDHKADVNAIDLKMRTALHAAAKWDDTGKLVKILIEHKADINKFNVNLKKPVKIALLNHNVRAAEVLLNSGARCDEIDQELLKDKTFDSLNRFRKKSH